MTYAPMVLAKSLWSPLPCHGDVLGMVGYKTDAQTQEFFFWGSVAVHLSKQHFSPCYPRYFN